MRNIDCILCGSARKKTMVEQTFDDSYLDLVDGDYHAKPRRWVECEACGFVYHDPQLDERDAAALYDRFRDSSFRNETPDEYFDRITSLPPAESENLAKVEWLRHVVPDVIEQRGRVLDIGCGGGVFLHTFLQHAPGWQAFGVEPTATFAELAARRVRCPVRATGYVGGVCGGDFDLITCNQVLEHTIDPKAFLTDIYRDLRPDGHLYVEVPDISDFRTLPAEHDRFLMQHLWYFAEETLVRLAQGVGFRVAAIERQLTKRARNNLVAVMQRTA